jgi:hypothetical protein
MKPYDIDEDGWVRAAEADRIAAMHQPARCTWCYRIYDLGTVTITGRYADCSVWKAPCCGVTVDDRGETGWKSRADYQRIGAGR